MLKQIDYLALSQMTYAMFYTDAENKWHAELVTSLPDQDYLMNTECKPEFSGLVLVEDWAGDFIKGFIYKDSEFEKFELRTQLTKQKTINDDCWTTDFYDGTSYDGGETYNWVKVYSVTNCGGSGGDPEPA